MQKINGLFYDRKSFINEFDKKTHPRTFSFPSPSDCVETVDSGEGIQINVS